MLSEWSTFVKCRKYFLVPITSWVIEPNDHSGWNDELDGTHTNTAVSISVMVAFFGDNKNSLVSEGPWPEPTIKNNTNLIYILQELTHVHIHMSVLCNQLYIHLYKVGILFYGMLNEFCILKSYMFIWYKNIALSISQTVKSIALKILWTPYSR